MKYDDIELAYFFVSSGTPFENTAFVSRSTGETFWCSDIAEVEDPPEDLYENDDYVEIPDRRDLDLGQTLVWRFVNREIPGLSGKVQDIFSRRGAYGRFKDFLADLDLLEKWHRFENDETKRALLEWCREVGIEIDE